MMLYVYTADGVPLYPGTRLDLLRDGATLAQATVAADGGVTFDVSPAGADKLRVRVAPDGTVNGKDK